MKMGNNILFFEKFVLSFFKMPFAHRKHLMLLKLHILIQSTWSNFCPTIEWQCGSTHLVFEGTAVVNPSKWENVSLCLFSKILSAATFAKAIMASGAVVALCDSTNV